MLRKNNFGDSPAKRFKSPTGSGIKHTRRAVLQPDGSYKLVPDRVIDAYAKIQSFKDSCSLDLIVQRFYRGDLNALNQVETFFADVSNGPKNYAEALQMQIDAKRMFATLPLEIQQKFNNSYESWILTMESDPAKWYEMHGAEKIVEKVTESEVKE